MPEPSHIRYTPQEGLCARTGLNIRRDSPERLLSYFESDLGSIHPDLCSILKKDRDRPFCHTRTITPAMRVALQQLLNCHFSQAFKKEFGTSPSCCLGRS
jgi:hypothetical protein